MDGPLTTIIISARSVAVDSEKITAVVEKDLSRGNRHLPPKVRIIISQLYIIEALKVHETNLFETLLTLS